MSSDKLIWEAILHVTEDRIQGTERFGQEKKAERLQKVVSLLYDIPESEK